MAIQQLARKLIRNIEDYGWLAAAAKVLAGLAGPVYQNRVYRIYRMDLDGREWEEPRLNDFRFGLVEPTDTDAVKQIEDMAEWLKDELVDKIRTSGFCLAVYDGSRVIGFNLVTFGDACIPLLNMHRRLRKSQAWSEHIAVHKDYRKGGLASQLRVGVFRELKSRGFRFLYGGALSSNTASLNLARKMGFREIADVRYRKVLGFEMRRYRRVRA